MEIEEFTALFKPKTVMGWRAIILSDPCVYCGRQMRKDKRTREHILPHSSGGHGGWENIAGACSCCNVHRSNRSLLLHLVDPPKPVLRFWKQIGGPFVPPSE